ncbi:hypothetical protein AVENP_0835 [Arcobacter venerupis]|uniref:Uncharacterized protein n=1 Tax=Arcobacter venerupis TaxID=1054033 RepID=A0AAE7B9X0_9BACT|nr:hypothetical protein [Arcobacter venerupis]QKF66395.1 hypothetical protein AVENP_0835 [Arcobacter venerupis]RWS50827.1 hypothetical protein CKA56_00370 [Arcobacter venerupis]
MEKNSFTLIETLISITFLSVVISGFIYSTYHDETNQKNYMLLNNLENSFSTKNYTNFLKTTQNLQVTINEEHTENIVVSKYQFENENIKVFKYEK